MSVPFPYGLNVLREALQPHLAWHGAPLSSLAIFLIALVQVRTVNRAELATGFCGPAQIDSNYKRLQRFFRHYEVDELAIAQTIVGLLDIPEPWLLSIDQAEWKFGETVFNILVLGVVYESGFALYLDDAGWINEAIPQHLGTNAVLEAIHRSFW